MTAPLNVLWLMSDEHNPFVAGFAGDTIVQTPAIDSIAAAGINFSAAYSPNPICVPARRGFHSGRMGSNIDPGNYEALGPYFGRMGYTTAWYGKQHWDLLVNPFGDVGISTGKIAKQRFKAAGIPWPEDSRLIEDACLAAWPINFNEDAVAVEQGLAFLTAHHAEQFFLGVSLIKPHFPFRIQQEYYSRYETAQISRPSVTPEMLVDLSTAMLIDRDRFGFANLTDQQCDVARRMYYGMVNFVDDCVAQLLAKLDEFGLREKTIVVYLADHGEMLGDHGIWYKNSFYEGSARVPLLISAPGMEAGVSIEAPANLIDVYPTLCDLCSLSKPEHLEGHSLVPLMDGSDSGLDRVAFSENKRHGIVARMIRTRDFKYCYYEDNREQLYDMQLDPREATNLADSELHTNIKAELKTRALENWNPEGLFDSGE